MRDGDSLTRHTTLCVQPSRNPLHQSKDRFSTMRSGSWVLHPFRHGFGLLCPHFVEGTAHPSAIIAISQHRFDVRIEFQNLGGLSGP